MPEPKLQGAFAHQLHHSLAHRRWRGLIAGGEPPNVEARAGFVNARHQRKTQTPIDAFGKTVAQHVCRIVGPDVGDVGAHVVSCLSEAAYRPNLQACACDPTSRSRSIAANSEFRS